MKKTTILIPSAFKLFKPPLLDKTNPEPSLRKQHIAKQSTIDSTTSLMNITLSEYLKILYFLKAQFLEDINIISAKKSFPFDLKSSFQPIKLSDIIKYKVHAILSVFPYFSTIHNTIKSSFSQLKNVLERYQLMLHSLEQIITYINNSIPTKLLTQTLDFNAEKDCLQYFLQLFPSDFFKYLNLNTYTPKIFSTIWRFFKNSTTYEYIYETLKLFLYGISIPSFNSDEYPLHKAVFEGNLPFIRRLCSQETIQSFYCNVEDQDPLGLTPLMYAIKLNRKDAVLVLTECGCNPKLRGNPLLKTPIEEAISQRAYLMLKYLLIAGHRLRQSQWEQEKSNLISAIEAIPDFSCEMNWECDSKFIPFAKKLAPSDTYKIFKRGSFLRVDMTLAGFSKMKCVRGNLSALFKGKGAENEGKFLIIDHEKKKIVDLLSDFDLDQLDNNVDELIRNEHMNSEFKAENVDFNPSVNWKGDVHREKISGVDTMKFLAKGGLNIQLNKKDYLEGVHFKEFKDFDEYFIYSIENSLLKEFQLNKNKSMIKNICDFMESDPEYLYSLLQNQEECQEIKKILELTSSALKPKESKTQAVSLLHEYHKKFLKEFKKNIHATIWLTENFQLQIHHLLPILEILSSISNNIAQFKDFLVNNFLKEAKYFPIKAIIPLFYTLNAVVTFQNFKFIPPKEDLFLIDKDYLSKELIESSYCIKTEGNQHYSSNHPKGSFLQDWKSFFQNIAATNEACTLNNLKPTTKKTGDLFLYKEDKDEKESEKSIEVAKKLFINLKNDLVNVYDDKNNSSSCQNSNNANNSGDFSANKQKTEIPSEKKMSQLHVFTTHLHNLEANLPNKRYELVGIQKKEMKKSNLTIKIEKNLETFNQNITANKVRQSKECHNITQLNGSTKNKSKKKFVFQEFEGNHSLNETKFFAKTMKHIDEKVKPSVMNSFFPSNKVNYENKIIEKNKHERIKSLDFNKKNWLLKSEDGDLLKKLHYQKIDLINNEEVMYRIKEVLDCTVKKGESVKGKKKFVDADIPYFKN